MEKEVLETADNLNLSLETKFKELCEKHDKECKKWFATQKINFGVLGIQQFGTMNSEKIKQRITLNQIMIADLKDYPIKT